MVDVAPPDPMPGVTRPVAGVLLTGGRSRRMGRDKATMVVGGRTLAARAAAVLTAVADPVVEVGPGVSGLTAVCEEPPGSGPLAALVAGGRAVTTGAGSAVGGEPGRAPRPATRSVLVVAVDLPRVGVDALRMIAGGPPGAAVIPRARGRAQYACARWEPEAIEIAAELVAGGARSLRALAAAVPVVYLDEPGWPAGLDAATFDDVDTPDDLRRLLGPGRDPRPASPPGPAGPAADPG